MEKTKRSFIYQDGNGKITSRNIYSISETAEHIQARCLLTGALKTFRKDRILEEIKNIGIVEERLAYHIKNNPPLKKPTRRPFDVWDVCFTGFKKADKDDLLKLAKDAELVVRSSVTHNLTFLCCGYNAGPKKIEKARQQGVLILSEMQFNQMLDTGEIPEEA